MNHEITMLLQAFRDELDACNKSLDHAGVPRALGSKPLSLKDRIASLVEADRQDFMVQQDLRNELLLEAQRVRHLTAEVERLKKSGRRSR